MEATTPKSNLSICEKPAAPLYTDVTTHSPSMLTVMLACVRCSVSKWKANISFLTGTRPFFQKASSLHTYHWYLVIVLSLGSILPQLCFFPLMLLVINICTYINPLLAEQSYAGERQTSQTQSTLPACDSSEYSVKSRRFHFAEVMLTYIILCKITKKDCDILLRCQSGCSPALAWVQSPLPPSSSNKANRKPHAFWRCLSWKVWSMVTPSNGIEKNMPNQIHCEVKRAGGFHEYICVFTGPGRFL